ncbi:conserved hypothetical protein [Histoplasma capsulatum var. duboisii H88]|uniref:Uncharacterized protein n=1 Tax=Ajellomyces capsulatus (strain H88) TaxID=544711 RepID=F0UL81_AJEC8|nr:conserved hypothetical protein [Histoplasma capsulatum var. duboisii H88]
MGRAEKANAKVKDDSWVREISVWFGIVIVEFSGFFALEFSFRVLLSAIIEANHRRTAAAIDEACSRERDRWHLEQRTISKVDTTVFEDSEEERGVSPVLEVLEEDSCIEAEVELIMYWEMRFASRRGHWLLGCNLPPSRRHQRSGSGTRRRISEQISTASQSSQQPAAGEDECKSDDGLYRVQVPLERSMPDSQQTVSTLDSKVVKALPSTNHAK